VGFWAVSVRVIAKTRTILLNSVSSACTSLASAFSIRSSLPALVAGAAPVACLVSLPQQIRRQLLLACVQIA